MSVEIANQKNPLLFSNRFIDLKKREKNVMNHIRIYNLRDENQRLSRKCALSAVYTI